VTPVTATEHPSGDPERSQVVPEGKVTVPVPPDCEKVIVSPPMEPLSPVTVAVQEVDEATAMEDGKQETEVDVAAIEDDTSNVMDAVSAGTAPTSLPDAVTAFGPLDDGTVNAQENMPVVEVVWLVHVCVAGGAPPYEKVPIVVSTENPVPVTVTDEPTASGLGLREIAGTVTVKVTEAITLFEMGSLTTTRPLLAPLVVATIPPGMLPEASVVNWSAREQVVAELVEAS
jgi:hypothetical protein